MNIRLMIAASIAASTIVGTASAQEQPWLADRRLGEGIGYRAGDLELHWGVAAEAGYDSNYFLRDDSENPEAVWRFRLTPSFHVSTLGQRRRNSVAVGAPPALNFRAGVFLSYNELLAADADDDATSDAISDNRHLDVGANARVDVLPGKPVGGDIYSDFLRTAEPSNLLVDDVAFDRFSWRNGAGVTWRPGGGLFDWRLGYEVTYTHFEDDPYEIYNNFEHGILTRGRWRFLPRTAILFDGQYKFVRYTNPDETSQNDGDFVQARVGLNGLITTRLAFLAMLGWNSSFYEDNGIYEAQNYDGYLAHGEMKWFLLPAPSGDSASVGLSSIAAGYMRNFSNSYLGSFYIRDRGYLNFSYFVGGVFLANIEGGFSHSSYPDYAVQGTDVQDGFGQNEIDARVFGEYRFADSFGVNTTFLFNQVINDEEVVTGVDAMGNEAEEDLSYVRWQIWLGLRYFM